MLPLATHCHTHNHLHPFYFVLFKYKVLVAKQHLTNTHTYTHTHTACMREQLAQALAMQQVLTVERDQAREQCQLVQEREAELIKQLERLRRTHSESMHHIG